MIGTTDAAARGGVLPDVFPVPGTAKAPPRPGGDAPRGPPVHPLRSRKNRPDRMLLGSLYNTRELTTINEHTYRAVSPKFTSVRW